MQEIPGPPAGRRLKATRPQHRLPVIKRGVTAAGHARPGRRRRSPSPPPVSPGPAGRLPSRPRPLSRCRARRPRPGLRGRRQARASPPRGAGSPAPGSRQRPSLQSGAGPGPHLPVRVGPPARRPGSCHSRGFRLVPEARAPRPERPAPRDVCRRPRRHRLPGRAPSSSCWPWGETGGDSGGGGSLQGGGRLGLAAGALGRSSGPSIPARRFCARPPASLSRARRGGAEAALPLVRPGFPGGASAAGGGRGTDAGSRQAPEARGVRRAAGSRGAAPGEGRGAQGPGRLQPT